MIDIIPKADDILTMSSTPCNICRNLEPPWPIEIRYLELEKSRHDSSCTGCKLLRIVLKPYAIHLETQQSGDLVTVGYRGGKLYAETWLNTIVIYADQGMF
jgi:MinD superfamily P-loop ATPase